MSMELCVYSWSGRRPAFFITKETSFLCNKTLREDAQLAEK